jgi:hypothetical protein
MARKVNSKLTSESTSPDKNKKAKKCQNILDIKEQCRRIDKARSLLGTASIRSIAEDTGLQKSTVQDLTQKTEVCIEKMYRVIKVIIEALHQLLRSKKCRKVIGYKDVRLYIKKHLKTCGKDPLTSINEFPANRQFYNYLNMIPRDTKSRTRGKKQRTWWSNAADIEFYGLSTIEAWHAKIIGN